MIINEQIMNKIDQMCETITCRNPDYHAFDLCMRIRNITEMKWIIFNSDLDSDLIIRFNHVLPQEEWRTDEQANMMLRDEFKKAAIEFFKNLDPSKYNDAIDFEGKN